jgi:hypothetical protein
MNSNAQQEARRRARRRAQEALTEANAESRPRTDQDRRAAAMGLGTELQREQHTEAAAADDELGRPDDELGRLIAERVEGLQFRAIPHDDAAARADDGRANNPLLWRQPQQPQHDPFINQLLHQNLQQNPQQSLNRSNGGQKKKQTSKNSKKYKNKKYKNKNRKHRQTRKTRKTKKGKM